MDRLYNTCIMRNFIAVAIVLTASIALAQEKSPALAKLAKSVPLPGVKGRIDHLAIDRAGKRLFIAALENNTLEVVDLANNRHARSVKTFRKPQGVAWLEDQNILAVACGEGAVLLYDRDFKVLATFNGIDDADNVRYDPQTKLLYIGYRDGLGVIDTESRKYIHSIPTGIRPESFQLERGGPRIFVNVPQQRLLAVADRNTRSVIKKLPLSDVKANFPMALDEPRQRLLIATRDPAKLLMLDTSTWAIVTSINCIGDADDICLDDRTSVAYVIGGEGGISAIRVTDSRLEPIDRISTSPGSRTGTIDVEARRLYVALRANDQQDAELRIYELPAATATPSH